MPRIKSLSARVILNSRCEWTVEAEINSARGSAPSGASKGSHEARQIEAKKAVFNIEKLRKGIVGETFSQKLFDLFLQKKGGKSFSRLGGNVATALSFAFYNANFSLKNNIFPFPLGNVLGGGRHGGSTDMQEFLVMPAKAKTFPEAVKTNLDFYNILKKITKEHAVNDEGALMPRLSDEKALELLLRIAEDVPVKVGIDVAASCFWDGKHYLYKSDLKRGPGEQIDYIADLARKYRLFYVEDALQENDFWGFAELNRKIGSKVLVCGDDLTVTSAERLSMAVRQRSINSIIIKPNQAGTITSALEAVRLARKKSLIPVISHRSGETEDVTISRLAVNESIPIIKAGVYGTRVVKTNELLRLWYSCKKPRMAKI
jgi:enolase